MAIGRVLCRLARASPAERRLIWPGLCRLRTDAMAAASARGQEGRACAMARLHAVRSEARASSRDILACAEARLHAVRAEAEASSRDISSCAEARARAAQAMIRRCQRQAGLAAEVAAIRLRQAHDRTLSNILYIAYGESAPKTPSPVEVLEYLQILREKAMRVYSIWQWLNDIMQRLKEMNPSWKACIFSCISEIQDFLAPVLNMVQKLIDMVQSLISCAPEGVCPFLGLQGLPFDVFPVEQGLTGAICLAGSCAGVMLMVLAGLCGCLILDIHEMFARTCKHVMEYCKKHSQTHSVAAAPDIDTGSEFKLKTFDGDLVDQATLFDLNLAANYLDIKGLPDLTCQTVADMIKGKSPEEIRKIFNFKNDFTKEEEEEIRKENQWAFE